MHAFLKSIVVAVLTFEASLLLRRTTPTIIAVTGSVGKTATKDAIYHVLKNHGHARKSEKSYNSEIGIPLTILGLPNAWNNPFLWAKNLLDGLFIALFPGKYPTVLVIEAGVDRPGDMAKLTTWLKPNIVVLTRLPDVPVHVEFFSSPEAVIAEKLQLVEALVNDGVLVYNHDDERINKVVETVRQQAIGYGRYSDAHYDIRGDEIMYENGLPTGMSCKIRHLDDTLETVRIFGVVGIQHAYNVAAAAAVAAQFDIPLAVVAKSMEDFQPPPGRMRLIRGLKDTLLIDDTYNSSPVAVERALQTLREIEGAERRIAVLGDMLELGQFSVREHEKVGEEVPKAADLLITLGVRARKIAETALEHGMDEANILQYEDVERAGKELQQLLQPGDIVLIKASQSIRAERIVKEVMAEPDRAEELLVRQGRAWDKN